MNRKSRRAARHNPPPPAPPAATPATPPLEGGSAELHFPASPPASARRIPSLDVLRGLAVLGILLMNIVSFAMPMSAYINPLAWGSPGTADLIAWALSFILVDGKMRALFALLFGASMLLAMERTAMDGRDPMRTQRIRLAWLMLFGVAHGLLLWSGDILMSYAILGAVAALFVRREPLDLAKLSFLCFGLHIAVALMTMVPAWFLVASAAQTGADADTIASAQLLLDSFGRPGASYAIEDAALYQGPWSGIFAAHLARLPGQTFFLLLMYGFETLGFMLLGMAMLKAGFLTGGWSADQYRRTARHCLMLGLPPMIALALWSWYRDFSTVTVFGAFLLWSFPWRIPLTVGYAALILALLLKVNRSALLDRVGAVGRMALTNYLASSILMTTLFYGWGLGLFGSVQRVALYAIVIAAWALMLFWSKPWLDRFAHGPFEWAWRSLARGGVQRFRR